MAPIIEVQNLNVWFGKSRILKNLSFDIEPKQVTAFIGPSNCGKTTVIRSLNRLNDLQADYRHTGEILFNGKELYSNKNRASEIARKISMVFEKPILFKKSIYENVAYSVRIRGRRQMSLINNIVDECLMKVQLWNDVKDKLHTDPNFLSIGQQQQLCIARALAADPEILIFDEPCAQLDATETPKFESILQSLKQQVTIIFVTNKRRQAARVSDVAGFLYNGELVEIGKTEQIFTTPTDTRTENYVTGRLG
ncbi:phosphate ABC transporter ATP-binding protein [Candidatus Poribacteria bacterium]|nr:phosphate ABC transporter ATP-binding protein [Candidatus Poribacteria bacterium]